ncbi:MAG: Ohr family peroxiredoxin [Bacteroides sp.]|nr:Ohr family peroxiredoxin [Bacteroides sp.]
MNQVIYTTSATTTTEGKTFVKSENGIINMEIRAPREMGGPGGDYTNPEQLFAAGFSSCFDSAVHYVAMRKKMKIKTAVTAKVMTCDNDNGGFIFKVEIEVRIPGIEQKVAEELVNAAEKVCPYSNSTRNNVEVSFHISTN